MKAMFPEYSTTLLSYTSSSPSGPTCSVWATVILLRCTEGTDTFGDILVVLSLTAALRVHDP